MKFLLSVILLVACAHALDISKLRPVKVNRSPLNPKLSVPAWRKVIDTSNYKKGTKPQPASSGFPRVQHDSRIVGGDYAQRGQFPWQAFLTMDQSSYCGGSLISSDYVLTAGHCGHNIYSIVAKVGKTDLSATEPGEMVSYSMAITVHESFDPNYLFNDICLVRLAQPIQAGEYINYIRLPPPSFASVNLEGHMVTVSGFGKYTDDSWLSNELRYVTLPVMSTSQCASAFPGVGDSQICTDTTGGHSACNGDSGGPLVIQVNDGGYYEVGLVSFGSNQGCTLGMPAVFTRITSFLSWIESNTGLRF